MVHRTQTLITAKERYRRDIECELAKFEKRENEFMAQERRERAAQLGLALPDIRKEATN